MTAAFVRRGAVLRPFDSLWWRLVGSRGGRAACAAGLLLLVALALLAVLEPHWRASAAWLDQQRGPARADLASATWPAASAHAARVSALLGLARRHGIQVRGLREEAAAVVSSQAVGWRGVSLSVEGRYAELRDFAASALASDASLALDSLVLQRADLSQALLRAEFGFAFGHAAPPMTPGAPPTRRAGVVPERQR